MLWYGMVWYGMYVWMVWYGMVWYGMEWYGCMDVWMYGCMYVCIYVYIYIFRYIYIYIWIPNFMVGWPKPVNPMFQPWHICHYHCAWFAEVRPCSYYANIAWRRSSTSVLGGAKWMFFLQLRIQIAKSMIMYVYIYIYSYTYTLYMWYMYVWYVVLCVHHSKTCQGDVKWLPCCAVKGALEISAGAFWQIKKGRGDNEVWV